MAHVLVKCLCAALICSAAPAVAASATPPTTSGVALFIDFERTPDAVTVKAMQSEVERILDPSGLRPEWHILPESAAGSAFRAIAVIHVKGECKVPSLPATTEADSNGIALASTHVSDGRVLPFTDLQCSRIGEYISPLLAGHSRGDREQVLGRAMGRVLAHELYHIFSGSEKHADGGIARSYHRRQELVAPEFDFEQAENEVFRAFRTATDLGDEASEAGDDSVSAAGR